MQEIGCCREESYRSVGSGTKLEADLDCYDPYYQQLIIWDEQKQEVVGGYRLAMGKNIREFGLEATFLSSIFTFEASFQPILEHSLELGRAFITVRYQKNHLPLFLLWKAIYSLLQYKKIQYMIGAASISGAYPDAIRSQMLYFFQKFYFSNAFSEFIQPKQSFVLDKSLNAHAEAINETGGQVRHFERYLKSQNKTNKIPILIKKHIQINSQFLGFNLDPQFSNVVDCLMIVKKKNMAKKIIKLFHNG